MKLAEFLVGKKYRNKSTWSTEDSSYITVNNDGEYFVTNKYGESVEWEVVDHYQYDDDWIEVII